MISLLMRKQVGWQERTSCVGILQPRQPLADGQSRPGGRHSHSPRWTRRLHCPCNEQVRWVTGRTERSDESAGVWVTQKNHLWPGVKNLLQNSTKTKSWLKFKKKWTHCRMSVTSLMASTATSYSLSSVMETIRSCQNKKNQSDNRAPLLQ